MTAVQTAIWDEEYGASISPNPFSGESTAVEAEIAGIGYHGGGYATGLIGLDGEQSRIWAFRNRPPGR